MKYQLLILTLVSFISCGPHADRIKVSSQHPALRSLSFLSPVEYKFDSEMYNSSVVIYPNPDELKNMAFDPIAPGESLEASQWTEVVSKLSYKDRLPRGFRAEEDNKEKVITATRIILSMGEARDDFYKEAGIISLSLEKKRKEFNLVQKNLVSQYPCYYPGENESGRFCQKGPRDQDPTPVFELASDCATLKEWKFNFEGADLEKFREEVESCLTLSKETVKMRREITKNKIAPLLELRKKAKGIVVEMLTQMQSYNSQRYLITLATTEDPTTDQLKSHLVFGDNNQTITSFDLLMESGEGSQNYSMENGGIQNLKWFKDEDGVWVLSFKLVDKIFQIEAKLAASVVDIFGLGFVGDIIYTQGNITRKGVMKLEFNRLP